VGTLYSFGTTLQEKCPYMKYYLNAFHWRKKLWLSVMLVEINKPQT
jgi:hypothetical protein